MEEYKIPLHNKKKECVDYAIVDKEMYEILIKYKWYRRQYSENIKYALACINKTQISMHKYILKNNINKMVIDHINNNGLDNRKENLRIVSRSQNTQNRNKIMRKNTTSKYIGVSKCGNKWASIYKSIKIGYFINELEAAKEYDKYALIESKGIAKTNGLINYNDIKHNVLVSYNKNKKLPENIYIHTQHLQLKHNKIYYTNINYKKNRYVSKCFETIDEANLELIKFQNIINNIKKKEIEEHYKKEILYNDNNLAYIPLKNNKQCIVDKEKWHDLMLYKWSLHDNYVIGFTNKTIRLHRYIMNANENDIIDHINNNTLDNRIKNLRISDSSKNSHNRIPKNKYIGVKLIKDKNLWVSTITHNKIRYNCGCYDNEIKAAIAYNIKAIELYNSYANINNISIKEEELYKNIVIEKMKSIKKYKKKSL
jgi:hypothetical protein